MAELVELCWDSGSCADAKRRFEKSRSEDISIRFTLDVGGVKYARVLNDAGDAEYDVVLGGGRGACGCPDFRVRCRGLGIPCKHLFRLKDELGSRC